LPPVSSRYCPRSPPNDPTPSQDQLDSQEIILPSTRSSMPSVLSGYAASPAACVHEMEVRQTLYILQRPYPRPLSNQYLIHPSPRNSKFPPPQLIGGRVIPLPSQALEIGTEPFRQTVQIHPILTASYEPYPGKQSTAASISKFDISLPPPYHAFPLDEAATAPALPSLALTFSDLPWPIVVQSWKDGRSSVTVGDLLDEMYQSLQLPLSEKDRYEVLHLWGLCAEEPWKLRRRIDCLQGKHRFLGLSPSEPKVEGETWKVHVGKKRGSGWM
jgi:hypothetical protein